MVLLDNGTGIEGLGGFHGSFITESLLSVIGVGNLSVYLLLSTEMSEIPHVTPR